MYTFSDTANCEGTDPEAFFTQDRSSTYTEVLALKRICGNCNAVKECLDYALRHQVMGYWGNTNEIQRKIMRKKLNIIPRPLHMDYN